jgi:hypothetical protein
MRNIQGRPLGHYEDVHWQTNEPPTLPGGSWLHHSATGQEVAETLNALLVPLYSLLSAVGSKGWFVHLPAAFGFVKALRALGVDADPGDNRIRMALVPNLASDEGKQVLAQLQAMGISPGRYWAGSEVVDARQ